MFLPKNLHGEKIDHVSTVTHEGKVVVFAVDTDGVVWYTVKQDGFEDSALHDTHPKGWEQFKKLPLPNGEKFKNQDGTFSDSDPSVKEREENELTYGKDSAKYLLRSRYKTDQDTEPYPVQLVSGMDHIYVFRQSKEKKDSQSKEGPLLVDRFVLDGMTNELSRKLDIRYKRSRQKHKPIRDMKITSEGRLNSVDSLDFRDADNKPFYEPTTELSLIGNVSNGWFSVVLTNTAEQDKHRWHIFAYNQAEKKFGLTTLRASSDGLFEVQDYRYLESSDSGQKKTYASIPGVIRRTLDLQNEEGKALNVTNGFAAVNYDVQRERETKGGKQLVRDASKVMLAVPTDQGTAALSFSVSVHGTLSQIGTTGKDSDKILRSNKRDLLLPLNLLDNIRAVADKSPPPHGTVTGLMKSTDPNTEDRITVKVADDDLSQIKNGDIVEILHTKDYNGLYAVTGNGDDPIKEFFNVISTSDKLGDWKKIEPQEGGLTHDGEITHIEKTTDGKLKVFATNHGLRDGRKVQITGTRNVNGRYSILALNKNKSNPSITIGRTWHQGDAIDVEAESKKRRGIHFDGNDDYIEVPNSPELENLASSAFTIECWVKCGSTRWGNILAKYEEKEENDIEIGHGFRLSCAKGKIKFDLNGGGRKCSSKMSDGWHHVAISVEEAVVRLFVDGKGKESVEVALPKPDQPFQGSTFIMV